MNQILITRKNTKKKANLLTIYNSIFIISILIATLFLFWSFKMKHTSNINEEISKKLTTSYSISTLYSNETSYISEPQNISTPFVIGIIKIDKISLNYSILSITNNDLLDISVCKFAGPMPNEVGNLCIAGHNYVDYKFFSRLNELEKNDIITIYDLTGNSLNYSVYDIYESKANDLSCTSQETNNSKIVTLITCNNMNGKRLIVKAKEVL